MAFKLDGKPLAVDVAFTHKDIQYPANWLRLTTKAEKEAIGITEVETIQYMTHVFIGVMELPKHLMM